MEYWRNGEMEMGKIRIMEHIYPINPSLHYSNTPVLLR